MVSPYFIAAAVACALIFLRIVTSSRSRTESSKLGAAHGASVDMRKVEQYEKKIELLDKNIRNSRNDRQREMMAKQMELILKNKERLKKKAELLARRS